MKTRDDVVQAGERSGGPPADERSWDRLPVPPDDLPPPPPWLCVHCGTAVDERLDACWNCGAARGE